MKLSRLEFELHANYLEGYVDNIVKDIDVIKDAQVIFDRLEQLWIVEFKFVQKDEETGAAGYSINAKDIKGIQTGCEELKQWNKNYK